jgi:membrane protease YdiL (CAAX protease family)
MTFADFVARFGTLINSILVVLSLIALLLFMWGFVRFLWLDAGSSEARKKGQNLILWGIISLFVLFAMGGIINFFAQDIFGETVFEPGETPTRSECIPTANGLGCAM